MWLVRFDHFNSLFLLLKSLSVCQEGDSPPTCCPSHATEVSSGKSCYGGTQHMMYGSVSGSHQLLSPHWECCLAVAPMITGRLNLNPAGRTIGLMWHGSRGVLLRVAGKERGESHSQCSCSAGRRRSRWRVSNANSSYWLASAVQTREALSLLSLW